MQSPFRLGLLEIKLMLSIFVASTRVTYLKLCIPCKFTPPFLFLLYAHELWAMTKSVQPRVQGSEMEFLGKVKEVDG